MQVAIIGLGKIGKNVALHLVEQGIDVIAYNRTPDPVQEVVENGAIGVTSIAEIPQKWQKSTQSSALSHQTKSHSHLLIDKEKKSPSPFEGEGLGEVDTPMIVMLFVTAGVVVDEFLFGARANIAPHEDQPVREKVQKGLADILPAGSIIIDGGNSNYKDSQRRYHELKTRNLHYLDMGTSGGLEGARTGASLMVGGDEHVFKQVRPILEKIAVKDGLGYMGPSGAGHFVKMVHNAIEYAVVQAWGEGFELLHQSGFDLDLHKVSEVFQHGSIIRSYIADLLERALKKDPQLDAFEGKVGGGQTGGWAQAEALNKGVKTPALDAALEARKASLKDPAFAGKVISALRYEWGGHRES